MKRAAIFLLALSAASVRADETIDILEANKLACSNAEATLTFKSNISNAKGSKQDDIYKVHWAAKDASSLFSYLDDKGKEARTFVVKDGKNTYYRVHESPKPYVEVDYQRDHSIVYNILHFGLTAGGEYWFGDLLRDGSLKVVSRKNDLVEVEGTLPSGPHCHAWLKPSAGYLAVKTILENRAKESDGEIVVDKWEKKGNAYFPTHGIATHHESAGGNHTIKMELNVEDLQVGTVTDARFEVPELVPGSTIKDDVNREMWEIGPNGEKIYRGRVGTVDVDSPISRLYGWILTLSVCGVSTAAVAIARRRIERV